MRDRAKRRKFNRSYKPTFKLSKLGLVITSVVIVFALGLLYLSQSNKMATSGYDISKLEAQRQELKQQNEQLQIQASRFQSIEQIDSGIKTNGMVPVKQINYLPGSTSVAVNIK